MYDGEVVMAPLIFELEISHRKLPQLAEHARLLLDCWPDVGVFEGMVFYPRQKEGGDAFGGPFAAYYFLMRRDCDEAPSTLRVEKFLSVGTAPFGLETKTVKAVLDEWGKCGVTTVCGETVLQRKQGCFNCCFKGRESSCSPRREMAVETLLI
jgi:hypothetical protein